MVRIKHWCRQVISEVAFQALLELIQELFHHEDFLMIFIISVVASQKCLVILVVHTYSETDQIENRDKIYLEAPNPNVKKGCDRDFRAKA